MQTCVLAEEVEKYQHRPGAESRPSKSISPLKARLSIEACLSSDLASTTSHLGTQGCVTSGQSVFFLMCKIRMEILKRLRIYLVHGKYSRNMNHCYYLKFQFTPKNIKGPRRARDL